MKYFYFKFCVLVLVCLFLISANSSNSKKQEQNYTQEQVEENFHKVIDSYYFISDFRLKPSTRPPLNHYFWHYPLKIEDVSFELEDVQWNPELFPVTEGEGLIYQHLNRARIFYLDKKFERARNVLLSAKARAEADFKYLKRINYYIALTFLAEVPSYEAVDTFGDPEKTAEKERILKKYYANAANFMVNAFYTESDDPLLQKNRIKSLYNISAINFRFKSYMYAYKFLNIGLDLLAKEGSTDHYIDLLRLQAYLLQKSGSFFDAIKVYDLALRQDFITKKDASLILTQAANIYFDLNNYELAEDLYEKAALVDLSSFTPRTYALRAESLFWMNELDSALKMFEESKNSENFKRVSPTNYLDKDTDEFISLRVADIYLAKKDNKKATLEYFKLKHADKNSYFGQIAQVREACLDFYSMDLKNINHSREMFETYYNSATDSNLKELALSCLTMSYKDTDQMVEKVREFIAMYPESDYLDSMKIPLIKKQASTINQYFKEKKYSQAIKFFETNRSTLFKNIEDPVKVKLFAAYMDTYSYDKAEEFYDSYLKYGNDLKKDTPEYNLALVRLMNFYRQINDTVKKSKTKNYNKDLNSVLKKLNETSWNKTVVDETLLSYIERFSLKNEVSDLGWMFKMVTEVDSSKEKDFKCNYTYDVYKVISTKLSSKEMKKIGLTDAINKDMDGIYELVKSNETCSEKLLDIDKNVNKDNQDVVVKRCQSYTSMSKHMAQLCWNEAQTIENKNSSAAQSIYKQIVDVAPKDCPEYSLSSMLYKVP